MLFGITNFTWLIRQSRICNYTCGMPRFLGTLFCLVFLGSCFRFHESGYSPFQVRLLFSDALLLYQSNLPTLLPGVFSEQRFILLLSLDKRFLEKIGIWTAPVSNASQKFQEARGTYFRCWQTVWLKSGAQVLLH